MSDTEKTLNFYCTFYDQIQPHIVAYNIAKTPEQRISANERFAEFEESVPYVFPFPPLYTLEEI